MSLETTIRVRKRDVKTLGEAVEHLKENGLNLLPEKIVETLDLNNWTYTQADGFEIAVKSLSYLLGGVG